MYFLWNALDYVPRRVDDDCLQELPWLYDRNASWSVDGSLRLFTGIQAPILSQRAEAATICGFGPPLRWREQGSKRRSRVRERDGEHSGIRARAMNGGDAVSQIRVRFLVLRFIRFIHRDAPVLVFPAKEAGTQLASTNMVTIRLLPFLAIPAQVPFLAIPAQAGTHASTST
jgi:hypothetical protein